MTALMWIAWSKRLKPFVKLMSKNSVSGPERDDGTHVNSMEQKTRVFCWTDVQEFHLRGSRNKAYFLTMEESIMPRKIYGDFFYENAQALKKIWCCETTFLKWDYFLYMNFDLEHANIFSRSWKQCFWSAFIYAGPDSWLLIWRLEYVALLRVKNLDGPVKGR
jgi:hypothetical protein